MSSLQTPAGASSKAAFSAAMEHCPFAPTLPATVHHESFGPPTLTVTLDELRTHDAVIAQTESKLRISRSRSRQKRGPPTIFLS